METHGLSAKLLACLLLAVALGGCGRSASRATVAGGGPNATVDNVVNGPFTGPAIFQPDPAKTPGVLCTTSDPDFSQLRYAEQIPYCQRNISQAEKAQVAAAYGVGKGQWSQYEFDHYIPLSIGGSNAPENLFPQRLDAAHLKDQLELELFNAMASGKITQAEAVARIRAWHM